MSRIVFNSPTKAIPGNSHRRKLVFYNAGFSTVFWGWESTVTKEPSDNQGVPLVAGAAIIIDGSNNLGQPIYMDSDAGIVNYTQNQ